MKLEDARSETSSVGHGGSNNGGGGGGGEFLEDLDSITDLLPLPTDAVVDSSVVKDVEARLGVHTYC